MKITFFWGIMPEDMLDQITDVCIHPLTLSYSKLSQKLGLERSEVI
jgi:hypothetical protein